MDILSTLEEKQTIKIMEFSEMQIANVTVSNPNTMADVGLIVVVRNEENFTNERVAYIKHPSFKLCFLPCFYTVEFSGRISLEITYFHCLCVTQPLEGYIVALTKIHLI